MLRVQQQPKGGEKEGERGRGGEGRKKGEECCPPPPPKAGDALITLPV